MPLKRYLEAAIRSVSSKLVLLQFCNIQGEKTCAGVPF